MGKIATKQYCKNKLANSFTSDLTNCPTAQEIKNAGFFVPFDYENNRCVQESDITIDYTFTASRTSVSFSGQGGTSTITINSKQGNSDASWSISSNTSVFTVTKTNQTTLTISANNNTTTSSKGASIQIKQSGSNTVIGITINQSAGVRTYKYQINFTGIPSLTDAITSKTINVTYSKIEVWNSVNTSSISVTGGISSASIANSANNIGNYVNVNISGNSLVFTRRTKPSTMLSGTCNVTATVDGSNTVSGSIGITVS